MANELFDKNYGVKNNLNELKKRLEKGMSLKGRIIECPKENRYVLRVWGYNIYTDSQKQFEKFDEIDLVVKEVEPNLVFDLNKCRTAKKANIRTNIII